MAAFTDEDRIEEGAIKVIELVGVSPESFEDAVQACVRKASASLEGIRGIEVERFTARVRENKIVEYRAHTKLAFVIKK